MLPYFTNEKSETLRHYVSCHELTLSGGSRILTWILLAPEHIHLFLCHAPNLMKILLLCLEPNYSLN